MKVKGMTLNIQLLDAKNHSLFANCPVIRGGPLAVQKGTK